MAAITGWVEPPKYKKGLDPLGVQQPCIAVYSTLLPGLTNVTDRVAYYSFGPWFIYAFAQRYPKAKVTEFISLLRRAEVLLTLVGVRHAETCHDDHFEEHGGTLVGVDTLQPVVADIASGKSVSLSKFATLEDKDHRYFKNRRGGLGQYYLGSLRDEFRLLGERQDRTIDYTVERGRPMAEAASVGLHVEAFFRRLEKDRIDIDDLDALRQFCPCQLRTQHRKTERQLLLDAILGRRLDLSENAPARRRSLALLMDFLRAAAGCEVSHNAQDDFLVGCYAHVLPNRANWSPPERLADCKGLWAFYAREEMFSIAMQKVFREALIAIMTAGPRLQVVEDAGTWCGSTDVFQEALKQIGSDTYEGMVSDTQAKLPALAQRSHPRHEIKLWEQVDDGSGELADDLASAIRLISTLIIRQSAGKQSILGVVGENSLNLGNYPLNIDTLGERASKHWPGMSTDEWIADMVAWALATHRQVAFRKLAQNGDDTRRLRMGDEGLYVDGDVIEVTRTQPRLKQAYRFLRDLGLIERAEEDRLPVPTPDGLDFLERVTTEG